MAEIPFDWGRTSDLYAKYRDIYPPAFFEVIVDAGLCKAGQRVLDLGTGTGVLPRALFSHGANYIGADISPEQIEQARKLSEAAELDIEYVVGAVEDLGLPSGIFDVITACQCYHYFDEARALPNISRMLREGGRFAVLFMNWLPYEDEIARQSEELVLRYNPDWSGDGWRRTVPSMTEAQTQWFTLQLAKEWSLPVPFTRESWVGRMLACRGVAASLPSSSVDAFSEELIALMGEIAPPAFEVLHSAGLLVLKPINKTVNDAE